MSTIQEFDYSVNLLQALIWQYDEAANLIGLLNKKDTWYTTNQQEFWGNWFDDVFNLLTANDFGLAVWSIILNQPIYSIDPDDQNKPIFGFLTAVPQTPPQYKNFLNGNFLRTSNQINLTTEEARICLRLKMYQIISRGAIPETNTMLADVFGSQTILSEQSGTLTSGSPIVTGLNVTNLAKGLKVTGTGIPAETRILSLDGGGQITLSKNANVSGAQDLIFTPGNVWVLDGLDMTITYVFDFYPSTDLRRMLVPEDQGGFDLLPRPAGVGIKYVIVTDPSIVWGFGINNQNFLNGNFMPPSFI